MRAIDTNVLVRLLARDHPAQTAAAEEFITNGAWVSLLVLTETLWVLGSVYELKAAKLAAAVEMLLDHKQLILQDREVVGSALAIYRRKPALGFSDCMVLEQARRNGHAPLGTFAQNLSKIEGAQLVRPTH
jgi:predicted nucleic-acid-binding protein